MLISRNELMSCDNLISLSAPRQNIHYAPKINNRIHSHEKKRSQNFIPFSAEQNLAMSRSSKFIKKISILVNIYAHPCTPHQVHKCTYTVCTFVHIP